MNNTDATIHTNFSALKKADILLTRIRERQKQHQEQIKQQQTELESKPNE